MASVPASSSPCGARGRYREGHSSAICEPLNSFPPMPAAARHAERRAPRSTPEVSLPFEQAGSPGEACAEAGH